MKNKRSIELMLRVLNSKKVNIGLAPSGSVVIDVSKADDLGGKTWGYIDYLVKSAGYTLTGRAAYSAKYAIKKNDDSKNAKDSFSFPKKEGKWHSYSDIPEFSQHKNGKKFKTSEFDHLQELNHLQGKFNNGLFKKTDAEKLLLFEIKDKIKKGIDSRPFYNEKIWSTEYETVEQIPTNKK